MNATAEILAELRQGRMVVVMDDEDRENEGDLVLAATMVRPEDINFMARYGRGLICLTLTRERCKQLSLPLMVSANQSSQRTNFTVSIEAAEGVTTGISAYDRALTVRKAVAPDASPGDLVQPGHIFPLMAQPGGVLTRAGHTEAGCDLTRLAGLEPAAVIVEILNEDGTMARREDLQRFAATHELKIGTIADLIRYRLLNEKTVERVAECPIDTEYGVFRLCTYQDSVDGRIHYALVKGEPSPDQPVLVRVHLPDTLRDLLGAQMDDGSRPLRSAIERISRESTGVVVVLDQETPASETVRQIRMFGLRQKCAQTDTGEHEIDHDLWTYGVGAQILHDLGVRQMRVLSAPMKIHAISGFGLDVVEYVS